ncbi:MAG: hypothetical protein ACO4CS_18455 [bacterium]
MATITFSVELIYEGTGHFMNFEYDWEEFGLSRRELEELADDLVMGRDSALYDEIMQNISIVPTVENVSFDYGDDDESE